MVLVISSLLTICFSCTNLMRQQIGMVFIFIGKNLSIIFHNVNIHILLQLTINTHTIWTKQRQTIPNGELCSAELFNSKTLVPCDPVAYLNAEYGVNEWHTPKKSSEYFWKNIQKNGEWSTSEWPKVIRIYNRRGRIDKNETLMEINKYLSTPIDSL